MNIEGEIRAQQLVRERLLREQQSGVDLEAHAAVDRRDRRDASALGVALLALRKRSPKAPLSKLYDRHAAKLNAALREGKL